MLNRGRWSITIRSSLIVVRMRIFKSLNNRRANLTIYRWPMSRWAIRTIKSSNITTIFSWSIFGYDRLLVLLFPTITWHHIVYPDKKFIVCFKGLELCHLNRLIHSCWCLILLNLNIILLFDLFLLCKPLRFVLLICLEGVALTELFLPLWITTWSWLSPLFCDPV